MKLLKYIIGMAVVLSAFYPLNAQRHTDAREVLDATADLLTKEKGVKATFKAEIFSEGNSQGFTTGTICFENNKFQITTADMTTWFNGETQWTYIKANEEVNVSTPTEEELKNLNPYLFIQLYKEGYKYKMQESELRGKNCYEITLTAKKRNKSVNVFVLNIDKDTYAPMCIRMQDAKNSKWTRIAIHDLETGQLFTDKDFEFNTKDYPEAEVIDLR